MNKLKIFNKRKIYTKRKLAGGTSSNEEVDPEFQCSVCYDSFTEENPAVANTSCCPNSLVRACTKCKNIMVEVYGRNICLICRREFSVSRLTIAPRTQAVPMSNLPQQRTRTKSNKKILDNERREIILALFANNRVANTRGNYSRIDRAAASKSNVNPENGSSYIALKKSIEEFQRTTQRTTRGTTRGLRR